MEMNVGGQWETSTPTVGVTKRYDHSVDIQHGVVVSRAAICASSGEGSLVGGLWISRILLVYAVVTTVHPRVRVVQSSDDRGMETAEEGVTW